MNYDNMHLYPLSHNQRRRILEIINTYYSLHLPSFGELKSLEVLRDIVDLHGDPDGLGITAAPYDFLRSFFQ